MQDASLDEKNRDYLQNVIDSGGFLLNLINDILDLGRVQSENHTAFRTLKTISEISIPSPAKFLMMLRMMSKDVFSLPASFNKNRRIQEISFSTNARQPILQSVRKSPQKTGHSADRMYLRRVSFSIMGNTRVVSF